MRCDLAIDRQTRFPRVVPSSTSSLSRKFCQTVPCLSQAKNAVAEELPLFSSILALLEQKAQLLSVLQELQHFILQMIPKLLEQVELDYQRNLTRETVACTLKFKTHTPYHTINNSVYVLVSLLLSNQQ